jgi:hypothetical protein
MSAPKCEPAHSVIAVAASARGLKALSVILGGFRIFLLDDDPLDTELIRAALKQGLDCHVVGLRTRPEFLAALDERVPDVIVSDCR